MDEEVQDVTVDSTEESSTEIESPDAPNEPVDEMGVPLKNRAAEAERKQASRLKQLEAENNLLGKPTGETTEDEAVKIVEQIADRRIAEKTARLETKQFLLENPDAVNMVDDINRVRQLYPELASVEKLEVAYKIAKAEKLDESIRQAQEKGRAEAEATLEKSKQATLEGTGKVSKPEVSITEKIKEANSIEELEALATQIK